MDCVLCKATTKPSARRLVRSSRNEHLKVILEEFVAEVYSDSVSVMLPPHSWLCRTCARNLEKLKSLRDELNRKEAELRGQVNAVGKLCGLDVQVQRVEGDMNHQNVRA